MDQKVLNRVNREVYKKFPELDEAKPRVARTPMAKSKSDRDSLGYTLTYRRSIKVSESISIPLVVRVVCTEDGHIQKLSSSK